VRIRDDWPLIALIGVMFAIAVIVFPTLPDRVPSHWNFRGEIDGYSGRFAGAFMLPLLCAGLYALLVALPRIDPRRQNYASFAVAYRRLRFLLVAFFMVLYLVTLASAMGYPIRTGSIVLSCVGLLFVGIGSVMGSLKPTYFVGIRTPWTLADDVVWERTHSISAPVWMGAGALGVASPLLPVPYDSILFMVAVLGASMFSVVYSYILYRSRHMT
jgi:uncharacterized membrane protein